MEVQLAVLADAANISQEGKLNILGEFDTIWAAEIPVVLARMWFVAKVKIGEADGSHHKFELRVLDDDGELVAPIATIEGDSGPSPIPGALGGGNVIIGINNARFPDVGTYVFELRGNTQRLCEVPLHVRPLSERAASA